MDTRKVILKVHLYLGLVSAIFLIILGLTGSIMAFEGDIDHWLHPRVWYVTPGPQTLPESQLIQKVEQQFAPAHVMMVQLPLQSNLAQLMLLPIPGAHPSPNPRVSRNVIVNPYDGSILGVHDGATKTQATLAFIHQLHLRLVAGQTGKLIVSFVGLILFLEVPLGLILWWRTKRASVQWKASGFRLSFDLHHAVGVYAAVFLLLSSLTGVLIGFDFAQRMFYTLTHSSPLGGRPVQSTVVEGATPIGIDKAMEIARQAMPNTAVAMLQPPGNPRAPYLVSLRGSEDPSGSLTGNISVDQYSGQVLRAQNLLTESTGYRAIRLNRSLHTGDIYGMPSQIIMSITSLVLVVMVVTGIIIWWKKLAV